MAVSHTVSAAVVAAGSHGVDKGFFEAFLASPSAIASVCTALLGAFLTMFSLGFVKTQIEITRDHHNQERRWKRSEFVRNLLSQMIDDPNIGLIARVLDWREGPARIPEYFLPMFDKMRGPDVGPAWDHPRVGREFFEINWERFVDSLQVLRVDKSETAEWRQPDKIMYRTCFDSFCAFIQGIAADVRGLGVQASEYADLSFYCHRVIFPRDAERVLDTRAQAVIRTFIETYYDEKTYDVFLIQAEVYALRHEGESLPSMLFPNRCKYPTPESLNGPLAPIPSRWTRSMRWLGLAKP